jgi:Cu/Ag efflux pump CusA
MRGGEAERFYRGPDHPLALALGAGSWMLQPLAVAVIGGLMISMLLSLVVMPAAYYLLTRTQAQKAD